jgi:hypothetical protein
MRAQETEDPAERVADMIIHYAYVPGTDEKIFEPGDRDTIIQWPFGEDLQLLQGAITELTGVNMDKAEKQSANELRQDPLESESSGSASS